MGLYESVMRSQLSKSLGVVQPREARTLEQIRGDITPYARPMQQPNPYGLDQIRSTPDPVYQVSGETSRITRELQFRTMSGQLSEKIFVVSSNVVSMSYNAERQQLTVEFQRWVKGVGRVIGGGARYLYNNITLEEWKSAKLAGSKGKWVWAVLRRGGKPYMRVR